MSQTQNFNDFYKTALDLALDRSGRPDIELFKQLAAFTGTSSINVRYYERLAKRDWLGHAEGARDLEPCAFYHPKIKSHFVRYYGITSRNLHYMEVHARAHERLRTMPELIEKAEQHVVDTIEKASSEIMQYTEASLAILAANGVSQGVRYGTGPLLVPAEIISPYCGMYLDLIMKADRLLGLLEYQRLRRYMTNQDCDKEFARVDRLLKSVSRTAFELQKGLRQRATSDALQGPTTSSTPPMTAESDDDESFEHPAALAAAG